MKTKIKTALCLALFSCVLSGCIDEEMPNGSLAGSNQIDDTETGVSRLVSAVSGYEKQSNNFYTSGQMSYIDFGYPTFSIIRDQFCEDAPVDYNYWDYYYYYGNCTFLGADYAYSYLIWSYYYAWNNTVSELFKKLGDDLTEEYRVHAAGIGHFFRAMIYFDMARMYEFKKTGNSRIDNAVDEDIYGLTVPLITEKTTEVEARNLPRAPYYEMYDFILDELDLAETQLADYSRPDKSEPNLAIIYGEKARVWLELGTHFEKYPDALTEMNGNTDRNIASATECFEKAADYASKAITTSGATPMTQSEWYSTTGFGSAKTSAWMLGILYNKEALSTYGDWINPISQLSVETSYGTNGYNYGLYREISYDLYWKIGNGDWRRNTWVSPDDRGNSAAKSNYYTILTDDQFAKLPSYTGLKYHPANDEQDDYQVASAADFPLMRVEEMYFIEAEAVAHAQGVAAGVSKLESFMNSYRYSNGYYRCRATTMDDFIDELMVQKRIEFWEEGIVYWDYKRLELPITRGYEDSNFPAEYQINSKPGYCAQWLTPYIPDTEQNNAPNIIPNPDPSVLDSERYTNY